MRINAYVPMPANSNAEPWPDWLLVPLSLSIGLVLMFSGIIIYYLPGNRYIDSRMLAWPGKPLQVMAGEVDVHDSGITLKRLNNQGKALLRLPIPGLDAGDYEKIRLSLTGLTASTSFALAWRDPSTPRRATTLLFPPAESGQIEVDLAERPEWRGEIATLGILAQGTLPAPITIHRIELLPKNPSVTGLLRQIGMEWLIFRGWSQRSINFHDGGPPNPLLSPVLAALLLVVLSILTYLGLRLWQGGPWQVTPFAIIFLAGWMILDARWQMELFSKLEATWNQYGGNSLSEKKLASDDRGLILLAEQIKRALPETPARLFLFPPSLDQNHPYYYQRVRLHYLLLPHKIGSLWTDIPPSGVSTGDYLFIWREHPRLRYDAVTGELRWGHDHRRGVERLLATSLGDLYRVR